MANVKMIFELTEIPRSTVSHEMERNVKVTVAMN